MDSLVFKRKKTVTKFAMLMLALYPILDYYSALNTPLTYAGFIGIVLFIMSLGESGFKSFNKIPGFYYLYWAYAAFQIYYIAGVDGWSDYLPGGIYLVLFSLALIGIVYYFDYDLLLKYMKVVFVISSVVLLLQYILFFLLGTKMSFFLPLSSHLTYGSMSYSELVAHQTIQDRLASIFAEPSHFAQYTIILLAAELFSSKNRYKLYTGFSLIIIGIIVLIQSGAGVLGVILVYIIKVVYVIIVARKWSIIPVLLILIPIVFYSIQFLIGTEIGEYLTSRTGELSAANYEDNSGGSDRLFFGWFVYGEFDTFQKLLGTSRTYVWELTEFGFYNGITYVLCTQGLVGLLLLMMFYIFINRKQTIEAHSISIIFLGLSFISATYLSGNMMICTVIVLGLWNSIVKRMSQQRI